MIVSDNIWFDLVLMASVTVSVLAITIAIACVARMKKQAQLTQKLYQRLDHNLQVSNSSAQGMGKRLVALEKKFKQKSQSSESIAPPKTSSTVLSQFDDELKDAASLLHAGLEPAEVSRRCGISRAEASLLKLMHANDHQAA